MNAKVASRIIILHILGSAGRGGTETNTYDLVTHMADDFLSELCFLSKRGPIGEKLEHEVFKVHYLPLINPWVMPMVALRLYCLLRSNRYDILYLSGLKANFLGRILGRFSGHKRILGGLRSKYPSGVKKSWTLWLDRLTFSLSLGYVSNGGAVKRLYYLPGALRFDRRSGKIISEKER